MRRLAGQVARHTVRHTMRHGSRLMHLLVELLIAIAVLVGALTWRLSQGPLDLPWLTKRVEKTLNQDSTFGRIHIGSAALAWEGFRLGVDRPLDIQLRDVSFADTDGTQLLTVPRAEVSLSLHLLLLGRIVPRALEIDQPRIALIRAADGSITVASGPATADVAPANATPLLAIMTELARPPATDRSLPRASPLSQLMRLRIHDAAVQVVDQQFGMTWWAPHADLDLTRQSRGGVDGTANVTLALGNQQAQISGTVILPPRMLPPGKAPMRLRLRTTPVVPANLARVLHLTGPLAGIQAPISGEADLLVDDRMALQSAHVALQAGTGIIDIADGVLPISQALVAADITPNQIDLRTLRLELPASPGNPPSVLRGSGTVTRAPDRYSATLGLTLNQVTFADLPRLWPLGVGHGARTWITENITAGVARDGHVDLALEATPDLSDVTLTRATGSLTGTGLRVTWLDPVPPIIDGSAVLTIVDPDTLEITVRSGRQAPEPGTGAANGNLVLRGGRMRITGILQPHQVGSLEADIAGPIPDAIALLGDPRLRLLSKHPLPLTDPTGTMTGRLAMTIPLEANVTMDDIGIRATAHLQDVHLGDVVAGRDLDNGTLDLEATTQGLRLTGKATLAGIPTAVTGDMDFRAGGPSQVLQRITVEGRATTRQLAAAGVDVSPIVDGPLGLTATLTERRDGGGAIALNADLTPTTLAVAPLGWRKPPGQTARAAATVRMLHDRLTTIDDIAITGEGAGTGTGTGTGTGAGAGTGLAADGSVTFVDGKPAVIHINQMTLGRTEASGTIRLPIATPDRPGSGPIAISMTGRSLDLSGHFASRSPRSGPRPKPQEPSGPHWTLDARFDQVLMAADHRVVGLSATLDSNHGLMNALLVTGETESNAPFSLRIVPSGSKRVLEVTSTNAGELLAALDIVNRIQGGQLSVTGAYDDTQIEHPLSGTAQIDDFRVRNAPVLARLLQGMTLYGLVELLRGPGLGFTHLVAPFKLTDDALTLTDARAFSPSLGLTAKGIFDVGGNTVDVNGTIVPAYFFNSLLGDIPLVGRLFSPERGGGVFAASYSVRGPLDDPDVSVNPLSALTPGFLRGLFGLF